MLVVLGAATGLALMRGAAARLHLVSAAGLLAPPLVAAAILSDKGRSQAGIKALLIACVLVIQGPVVAHVIGRAIYGHERAAQPKAKELQ